MFTFKLLGPVSLLSNGHPVTGPAVQRHRLALLALLARGRQAQPRDKLMAWLWPERDQDRARGLLNQAVHALRQALGHDSILSVREELQLNPAIVSCDVPAFEEAIAAGRPEEAATLYAGPLLEGFFLSEAPEFERWVDQERDRLARSYAEVLASMGERAEQAGDWPRAVEWWKLRVAQDPYDSLAVIRVMLTLEASGNRAAALLEARTHQRLLEAELGMAPSPEVEALAERLRATPDPGIDRHSIAPRAKYSGTGDADRPGEPTSPNLAHPPAVPAPRYRRPAWVIGAGLLFTLVVLLIRLGFRANQTSSQVTGTIPIDEIAQAVARELALRQRGDTAVRVASQRTTSISAYELYLRGSDPRLLRSDSAARLALEYFHRAVELDSNYAAAWAGLTRLTLRTNYPLDSRNRQLAESAALRAIGIDDSLGEAHAVLGLVRFNRFELSGAESELRRAIALEPGSARYHEWLARLLVWSDRNEEAFAAATRALELEPLSPSANAEMARALLVNRRCEEALALLKRLADLNPPLLRVPAIAAQCHAQQGRWDEAALTLRPQAERGELQTVGLFGYLMGRAGHREEATRILAALRERDRNGRGRSLSLALVYAGLGETDSAIAALSRAFDDGSLLPAIDAVPAVHAILRADPGNPRIIALRRRLGLQNR